LSYLALEGVWHTIYWSVCRICIETAWGTISGIAWKVTEMDADMLRPQELSEAVIPSEDCSKAIFITMASINAIEMRLSQSHSQAIAHNHIVLSLSTRVADGKAMLLAGIRLLYQ
jgi:hypothetical protein